MRESYVSHSKKRIIFWHTHSLSLCFCSFERSDIFCATFSRIFFLFICTHDMSYLTILSEILSFICFMFCIGDGSSDNAWRIMEIVPCFGICFRIHSNQKCICRDTRDGGRREAEFTSRIIEIIFFCSSAQWTTIEIVYVFLTFISRNEFCITHCDICSYMPSFSETFFEDISYYTYLGSAFFFFTYEPQRGREKNVASARLWWKQRCGHMLKASRK